MSVKLRITVGKAEIEAAKHCRHIPGVTDVMHSVGKNCAIAKAICALFPLSVVGAEEIYFYKTLQINEMPYCSVPLPGNAKKFIVEFDNNTPLARLKMDPISFDIEVPDEVIETVGGVEEATKIINEAQTLEIV